MNNNQTIDGVLVSRELLDDLAGYGEGGKVPEPWMVEKLRALLDAPAKSEFLQSCEAAHLEILKHCKPVAQPQGEPVAWVECSSAWLEAGGYWSGHASDLQQRLTASEQRNEALEAEKYALEDQVRGLQELMAVETVEVSGDFLDSLSPLADNEKAQALLSRPTRWAEQPAPVAVVMPVRLTDNYGESEQVIYAQGWNACLDEVNRLNTK